MDRYQVTVPYPLPPDFIARVQGYERILVIEETYPVIEMQLADRRIAGRVSKLVPNEGELTPEVIRQVLATFLGLAPSPPAEAGARPAPARRCARAAGTARSTTRSVRRSPGGSSRATSAATRWG